jgi:hypothetical protein
MADGFLDPWVEFFKTILDMPTPQNLAAATDNHDEIAQRNKQMFWKIKGITAKATYRLFMKYGDPNTISRKDENAELTK